MTKSKYLFAGMLGVLAVAGFTGCSRRSADRASVTGDGTPPSTVASTPGYPTIDCTAANPACPAMTIAGDPPAAASGANAVSGYADPAIRRDPATGALWMAYSWVHRQAATDEHGKVGSVVAVDSHLARSTDGGATWQFAGKLWTSVPDTSDTGEKGWRNQEVVSLASNTDGTQWFSARESYFTRPEPAGPKVTSFTIRVATASSPDKLAQSEEEIVGGALTASFWKPDVNLSSLAKELAGCVWRDPGILYRDGKLYLAAQCSLFTNTGERTANEFVGVFATQPQGPAKTWKWQFVGKLTTPADAEALGGEMLEQTELDVAADGSLIALFSPSKPSSPLATHFGCRAVKVASIDPPQLARDSSGKPVVLASVTASDVGPFGPAACTFEPASSTGIVLARRVLDPGLTVTLNRTGLLR